MVTGTDNCFFASNLLYLSLLFLWTLSSRSFFGPPPFPRSLILFVFLLLWAFTHIQGLSLAVFIPLFSLLFDWPLSIFLIYHILEFCKHHAPQPEVNFSYLFRALVFISFNCSFFTALVKLFQSSCTFLFYWAHVPVYMRN